MTLGSLFDGSGGFPLAGLMNGITPVWASEIEPFPIRVTTKRMPFMKHYGDVSQISGADIEPVDIITFGSPCQDLSVAGKREGLDGNRSGLFRQAIRIIKEMREKTNGMYPTFAVWENVPGALSSGRERGEDFRIVLESFCQIIDSNADVPRPEKWSNAGTILGDGYSVAWRILDAQYWGVPQRRRRIFLVADFAGERAGRILFKPESVSWDSAKSRRAWKTAPADSGSSVETADCSAVFDARGNGDGKVVNTLTGDHENSITDYTSVVCEVPYTMKIRCGCEGGRKGALIQKDKSATIATNNDQTVFVPNGVCVAFDGYNSQITEEKAATLGINCGMSTERNGVIVLNDQGGSVMDVSVDKYSTLRTQNNGHLPVVVLEGNGARPSHQGCGYSEDDVSFTLNATEMHGVAYGFYPQQKSEGMAFTEEKSVTLCNGTNPGYQNGCLNYIVRRLTPTECARLQGFPDWWCSDLGTENPKEDEIAFWSEVLETENPTEENLPFWRDVFDTYARINGTKPRSDKQVIKWLKNPHTDSAEYKMWGNGVALPCVDFVLWSIADVIRKGD